jgi:hypothetical protein
LELTQDYQRNKKNVFRMANISISCIAIIGKQASDSDRSKARRLGNNK